MKDENLSVVKTLDEWNYYMCTSYENRSEGSDYHMSFDAMFQIASAKSIAGYMIRPIGFYNGTRIEARSKQADSIEYIIHYLNKFNGMVFPYTIMSIPPHQVSQTYNSHTGEFVQCVNVRGEPSPIFTPAHYIFRIGHIYNENI